MFMFMPIHAFACFYLDYFSFYYESTSCILDTNVSNIHSHSLWLGSFSFY